MITVYEVFWFPPNTYQGGIAKILKDYKKNEALFNNAGFILREFNHQYYQPILAACPIIGSKLHNIAYMKSQRKAIIEELHEDKTAIVHIQTSRKWTLFRDLLLARSIKKYAGNSVIATIHFAEKEKILYKNYIIARLELNLMNHYLDKIIFLGNGIKEEFISSGIKRGKCEVLFTFHNYDLKDIPKKTHDPFRLIYMGSLDKRKGIIDLLEAMLKLSDYNITLDICGGEVAENIKDEFNTLVKQLGEKVKLNGYVSGKKKEELLKQANVFILPSYGEGMPIVLMEALATGCGIITTPVGSIPELIKSENGILIPPGDVHRLVKAILFLYSNEALLANMGSVNFEKGRRYTIKNNIDELLNIYKEV